MPLGICPEEHMFSVDQDAGSKAQSGLRREFIFCDMVLLAVEVLYEQMIDLLCKTNHLCGGTVFVSSQSVH